MQGSKAVKKLETSKDLSRLIKGYYGDLALAKEEGRPIAWVTGAAPIEIPFAMDVFPAFPENYSCVCGSQGVSMELCQAAERWGFSQDLCSYARTNLGLVLEGSERAPGGGLPAPDLLIATQTACTTHVKWWETLSHRLNCPLMVVDAGFPQDGELADYQREYFISELKRLAGFIGEHTQKKLDIDRLREVVRLSDEAAALWDEICAYRRNRPSPIGPMDIFTNMFPAITLTGTKEAVDYYLKLREEVKDRADQRRGAIAEERYRLLWDMIPLWYDLGLFSYLEERGGLVVCDIYARAFSGRMDSTDPFSGLADRYLGMPYLRAGVKGRTKIFKELIQEYQVEGAIFASNRSCRLVSIGQLDVISSLKEDLGIPIASFDADMTDPRMFDREKVLDILDSLFDRLDQRRGNHGAP